MRGRGAPVALLVFGVALLLGWYVAYTQRVVTQLRREAAQSGRMYARVFQGLTDTTEGGATSALFDLSRLIDSLGVPVVVTDAEGRPTASTNLPFEEEPPGARARIFARQLDRRNAPVAMPGVGLVHFGDSPVVSGLRFIPALQATALGALLLVLVYSLRVRARADREQVWAGMARESAHQLGTPLSSLSGWIELLSDREGDALTGRAVTHMRADLERLERVAHRFERIGRAPRREPVDLGALVERVVAYFRPRVPSRANAVTIRAHPPREPLVVQGDAVLLEWVLESLVKNAVDALAGRGGRIDVTAERAEGGAVLRVADDGPGVPRELRRRIFEAGFSTKERGWGIGLSLSRRIVEDNHQGRLLLASSDRGATFEVILG